MAPALVAENLQKRFGRITAVDGLGFSIEQGEIFGFLGPNGAGKSTTIGMLSGLLKPDSGTIRYATGGSPDDPQTRAHLGVAPQSLSLYREFTGIENVRFFGRIYGLSGHRLEERARAVLELVGLWDRANDRAEGYSGGMARRLNLACALVHDPPLLFLDEPTAGVDPQSRLLIFKTIETLAEGGRTILYTTHYMEEAERLCDRVAIIDHGRLLDLDTVPALIERHGGPTIVEAEFADAGVALPDLGGTWEESTYRIRTAKPTESVTALVGSGATPKRLRVESPSLEDVFLHLTGRSLRDQ